MVNIKMKDKNFNKLMEMLNELIEKNKVNAFNNAPDNLYYKIVQEGNKPIKDMINALKGAKNEKGKTIRFTESEVETLQDIIREAITNEIDDIVENTELVNNLDSIYLKVGIKEEDKYWEE